MNTIYKPSVISPFQMVKSNPVNIQDTRHPASDEIAKSLGTLTLEISVEQDTATLETFKNIPGGVIAFISTVRLDGAVISVGRGMAVISKLNKWVQRTVRSAYGASIVDAIVRSVKVLDAIQLGTGPTLDKESSEENYTPITDSQKKYLTSLVKSNVSGVLERRQWETKIEGFSKEEASEAIKTLVNN